MLNSYSAAKDNRFLFTTFRWFRGRVAALIVAMIGCWQVVPVAQAAALTWDIGPFDGGVTTGGHGTWTNGLGGWNTGSGNTIWHNATPDSATFRGLMGTVTLGGA